MSELYIPNGSFQDRLSYKVYDSALMTVVFTFINNFLKIVS